jgi:hypothetical protein
MILALLLMKSRGRRADDRCVFNTRGDGRYLISEIFRNSILCRPGITSGVSAFPEYIISTIALSQLVPKK